MSMDVQRQIRENTLELSEFLKDLKGWEQTVKEKEKNISKNVSAKEINNSGTIGPRGQSGSGIQDNGNGAQETPSNQPEVKKTRSKVTRIQAEAVKPNGTPAGHTHNHFQTKWDKFDVDAALKELDEEDEDDRPVKKVSKRAPPPPRGSKSQTVGGVSKPVGEVRSQGSDHKAGMDGFPGSYGFDDAAPDAASEKDLGNEYFKEGKYVRSIDCYSRSIALQPTAVAYANRAMAAIKIKRFEDAELDCSEAISLDDRYTKAYARRGTARKELKKYLAAAEDFEFALRLEPENKELKKQYAEAQDFHEKGRVKSDQRTFPSVSKEKPESIATQRQPQAKQSTAVTVDDAQKPSVPSYAASDVNSKSIIRELLNDNVTIERATKDGDVLPNTRNAALEPSRQSLPIAEAPLRQAKVKDKKMSEAAAETQAAAARAAASAMAAVSRNIAAPRSSFEFELVWKGFSGNRDLQARLLKVMDPSSLPKVFKDSLGAPLLLEILQALELLFPDDADLAVQMLENLTKVGRFHMTVMFLTAKDKIGLGQLWEQVMLVSSDQLQARLRALRPMYRLA